MGSKGDNDYWLPKYPICGPLGSRDKRDPIQKKEIYG